MSIEQSHSGNGDNIAGNQNITYNISQALDPKDVPNVVREIMYLVITRKYEIALSNIGSYNKFPLSQDVASLFKILESFITDIKYNQAIDTSLITSELVEDSNSQFIDIYKAILVRSIVQQSIERAIKIYSGFDSKAKSYLLAVYDEFLATKDELEKRFNKFLYVLDNYSLFCLAKGLYRTGDYKLSKEVFHKLSSANNDDYIQYWVIANELADLIESDKASFSYINRETNLILKETAYRFLKLVSNKTNIEPVAVQVLITFFQISMNDIPEIIDAACKFREDIALIDKELGALLTDEYEQKPYVAPDWLVPKLESNQALTEKEINSLCLALDNKGIDINIVKCWLKNSEAILDSEILSSEFIRVFITSYTNITSSLEKNDYRSLLNDFLDNHVSKLKDVNPWIIDGWIDRLYRVDESFQLCIFIILDYVCKNVEAVAVDSPIYNKYLYSLLNLDNLKTLKSELDEISKDDWNVNFDLIQARYYLKITDYKQAQSSYEKFISDSESLKIWYEFLASCNEEGVNIDFAKQQLPRIPIHLFSVETENFEGLLSYIAKYIDFDFAERVVVNLFIDEPDKNANFITMFYFNSFGCRNNSDFNNIKSFKGVKYGVIYELKGEKKLKLIVDKALAKHKHLLNVENGLGQALSNLSEGDETTYQLSKMILFEKLSVSSTVYQLAKQIVSDSQHNYDKPLFYEFEIHKDSALYDMTNAIKTVKSEDVNEQLTDEHVSELSLYTKGKQYLEGRIASDEVDIVCHLLLDEYSNQSLTVVGGNTTDVKAIVLDIYSAIYLCMTDLYKSVIASKIDVYISQLTVKTIQLWINSVTDTAFLKVDEVGGHLFKTDAETIRVTHGSLIDGLNTLMNYATVKLEGVFDLPTYIADVRLIVSESVFSSIKLSISSDMPWLCLDPFFRVELSKSDEFKLVDVQNFLQNYHV